MLPQGFYEGLIEYLTGCMRYHNHEVMLLVLEGEKKNEEGLGGIKKNSSEKLVSPEKIREGERSK